MKVSDCVGKNLYSAYWYDAVAKMVCTRLFVAESMADVIQELRTYKNIEVGKVTLVEKDISIKYLEPPQGKEIE